LFPPELSRGRGAPPRVGGVHTRKLGTLGAEKRVSVGGDIFFSHWVCVLSPLGSPKMSILRPRGTNFNFFHGRPHGPAPTALLGGAQKAGLIKNRPLCGPGISLPIRTNVLFPAGGLLPPRPIIG